MDYQARKNMYAIQNLEKTIKIEDDKIMALTKDHIRLNDEIREVVSQLKNAFASQNENIHRLDRRMSKAEAYISDLHLRQQCSSDDEDELRGYCQYLEEKINKAAAGGKRRRRVTIIQG